MTTLERVQAIVRETLQAPDVILTQKSVASDITGWDSLSHAVVIFGVEEAFGIELDPEMEIANVGELIAIIDQKLGR